MPHQFNVPFDEPALESDLDCVAALEPHVGRPEGPDWRSRGAREQREAVGGQLQVQHAASLGGRAHGRRGNQAASPQSGNHFAPAN